MQIRVNNADGKYSPSLSTGALYGNLLPKRVIKVTTTAPAAYNLFYGYIESITPHPHLSQQDAFISAIDGLDFLARHELDTVLWKDKLTGYLVNEIADNAYGNILTNGNFEDGDPPDDWTLEGVGASVSRSTEQKIVGSYSAKLTRNGANCNLYQTISNYASYIGKKLVIRAWVYATVASRARLYIDDGITGWFSLYHSGVAGWEQLSKTLTVNATATQLKISCRIDTGDTSAYFDGVILVKGHKCLPGKILDSGQDTVPLAYWHKVRARFALEEVEDSELGFIYFNGAGELCFEDRHHRFSATHQTSQATFDDTMVDIFYDYSARKVFNEIRATITPWELKTIAELWRLEETPSIENGETITLWGNFEFFADAITTPVATTDYTANSAADGGGDDETANVTITMSKLAKAVKLVIQNDAAHIVYITFFRVRGTYYDSETKLSRKSEDATSQGLYQKRTLSIDGKYLTDADLAQNYCDYALGRFKDPQADIVITLINKSSTLLTQILSREISDRITVKNTELGLDRKYFINKMEHEITQGGTVHRCRWYLVDAENEDFWLLDYSLLGTGTKISY
ncbi:hypothetical protein ES703_102658 [subsurface metagenome]